jgi:NAD(P)-dependent dehydrogenase (short-subunit alcohol dehydrogenase family)
MDKFLEGKFAIVTGGTRGIGRAIAETLLRAGASVAVCGRSEDSVSRAVREMAAATSGRVIGRPADVAQAEDVAALFRFVEEQFGGLDVLVNNAGVGAFASVGETGLDQWRRILTTNLDGVFYCSHAAIPLFRKRGGGFIVNISSLAGKNAFAGGAAYNASKFGLNGFSEAMMLDHRYDNVRVSYIMPGSVATEFGAQSAAADWKIAPQDVADVVATVLRLPERTLVSRVEIRPSRPPRKG